MKGVRAALIGLQLIVAVNAVGGEATVSPG